MRTVSFGIASIVLVSSLGCYHATIETGASPSAEVVNKSFASGWIYGLVPPSTVSTQAKCTSGVAKVETQLSFVNQLVSFLTLGIYTPMQIKVTCAASSETSSAAPRADTSNGYEPAPRRVTAETPAGPVPPGMHWVGNARTKRYYPTSCAVARDVPREDQYFFGDENGARQAGYQKATPAEC